MSNQSGTLELVPVIFCNLEAIVFEWSGLRREVTRTLRLKLVRSMCAATLTMLWGKKRFCLSEQTGSWCLKTPVKLAFLEACANLLLSTAQLKFVL